MGKISKELMTVAGVVPKLKLGVKTTKGVTPTGSHRVTLVGEKIIRNVDPQDGKEKEYVEYTFEEKGEKKVYSTKVKNRDGKLSYFVQNMSEVEEGDELLLEMKRNGVKNYIEITPVKSSHVEMEDDEIEVEEDIIQ